MAEQSVENAVHLLVQSSRVSPVLRAAVATVEAELARLRDAIVAAADAQPGQLVIACDDGSLLAINDDDLLDDDAVLAVRGA